MRGQTLEELEGHVWPPPDFDSYLVSTVHQLRKKPLTAFTVEDLRIMIGQSVGLTYLMPLAVEVLEREPLAEGDYYPGDLLASVIRVGPWWADHPELARRVALVARGVLAEPAGVDADLLRQLAEFSMQVGV